MKLHPIVHDLKTTLWCGPGTLATISGQPSSVCMKALRDSTWNTRPIKGVGCSLLVKAAARLGYRLTEIKVPYVGKLTMAAWTRENAAAFAQNPVVLVVANHYVTIKGRSFNDNWSKTPVPLRTARLRRARVCSAYRVEEMTPDAAPPVAKPARPAWDTMPPPAPPVDPVKAQVLRLAKANGVLVDSEKGSDVIWVYAPPALDSEELDRHAGDHSTYDWTEAMVRVRDYVADLNAAASAKVATL